MKVSGDAHKKTWQKYKICIRWKVLIKVQQPFIKVPGRTYWNILWSIMAKFTRRKKKKKCLLFTKFITCNWNCFFSCPVSKVTFLSWIIFGISETRVAHLLQICELLKDLQPKHILFHYHSYFYLFIFFIWNNFLVTLLLSYWVSTILGNLNMSSLETPFGIEVPS